MRGLRSSLLLLLLGAVLALGGSTSALAAAPPAVDRAAAAIVVDARDGTVMYGRNENRKRPIASTTKLMTALLTLERAELTDVFTAPQYNAGAAESRINLRKGERMRVEDLLEALLLESANDAAVTLAQGVAGSRPAFVRLMNERAAELGLTRTSYANPIGLDAPGSGSSARDLARLSVRLLHNRVFGRIVDLPEAVLESGARRRVVDNRNDLVRRYDFVDGIKTGYTLGAGNVLVGAARRSGSTVISVVMGEPSEGARDADTLALLRWGLSRFRRVEPLAPDQVVTSADIKYRDDERAELVPRKAFGVTLRAGQRLRQRVRAPEELEGPVAAGTKVGTVTIVVDGKPVERVDLLTATDVPGAGPLRIVTATLGTGLTLLLLCAIIGLAVLGLWRVKGRKRSVRRQRSRAT